MSQNASFPDSLQPIHLSYVKSSIYAPQEVPLGCKAKKFFRGEAKKKFLAFAISFDALWFENFRDLNGAIMSMDTLGPFPSTNLEENHTGE